MGRRSTKENKSIWQVTREELELKKRAQAEKENGNRGVEAVEITMGNDKLEAYTE